MNKDWKSLLCALGCNVLSQHFYQGNPASTSRWHASLEWTSDSDEGIPTCIYTGSMKHYLTAQRVFFYTLWAEIKQIARMATGSESAACHRGQTSFRDFQGRDTATVVHMISIMKAAQTEDLWILSARRISTKGSNRPESRCFYVFIRRNANHA